MLDDLVSVIETLQKRIQEHGDFLRNEGGQREARTRTTLINPLLQALGWDPADPGLVALEYRAGVGWADYALKGPGNRSAVVIEAKRLGTFVENHLDQAVGYCIQEGIAYAGVTDGNHWQLYRTFDPRPLAEKIVLDVRIDNTPAHKLALQLLLLWRPNLASGQPVAAREPLLGLTNVPQPAATVAPETPLVTETPQQISSEPATIEPGWVSLPDFNPPGGSKPPQSIRFPGGRECEIKRWNDILVEVAAWLHSSGRLTPNDEPVSSSPKIYIVHSQPKHPTGNDFFQHKAIANGQISVNTHGSAIQMRNNTKTLLQHYGVNPADVHVCVE